MSKYLARNELSDNIQQTQNAIDEQHAKVTAMVADLSDWQNWTDGHIAEEVARLASLLAQSHAMHRVMHMLDKQGE